MKRILIADDDEDVSALAKFVMESRGHEVLTARDGKEALEMAVRLAPDLILLDITMPKVDGITVCGLVKSDARLRRTKVVMLSANVYTQDRLLAVEAGADGFLPKPLDVGQLVAEAESALAG